MSGCAPAAAPTWLGLEPLIKARLEAPLREHGARVISVEDMREAMFEDSLPKPSVRIVYAGYRPLPEDNNAPTPPGFRRVEQLWVATVAVRNVRDMREGAASRAEASPLCDAVLDLLDVWNPGQGYGPLNLMAPQIAALTRDGCSYIPFAFSCRFRRKKTCP